MSTGLSNQATLERLAALRADVTAMRSSIQERFNTGESPGLLIRDLSNQADQFVLNLVAQRLAQLPADVAQQIESQTSIMAIGGCGRREVAPFSDLDLLFLHETAPPSQYSTFVADVVRDIWDAGFKLGHSVRTIRDATQMARQDVEFATSLVETRLLWGNPILVRKLEKSYKNKLIRGRLGTFIDLCTDARLAEFQPHGWSAQQLEPDIKNSPGGLRDLHLIRWVGYAKFGLRDFQELAEHKALRPEDVETLLAGREFLNRIRLNLHFAAGRAQEVLTRSEQMRIATEWGYEKTPAQRAVEVFMQEYFRHATGIARVARRFVELQRPKSLASVCLETVLAHRADGIFHVGQQELNASSVVRERYQPRLEDILQIFELATLYQVRLSPQLEEFVREQVALADETLTHEAAHSFMTILGSAGTLSVTLRQMYETGLLEKVIPEFRHANCLMQFNQYHRYTVDEHTLRCIEEATLLISDPTSLGQAYRSIHNKALLHLALLLHDIGKGYEEDHSDVGARIAADVAVRLNLSQRETDTLVFLVHKHLIMALRAFRRDTSDPSVLLRFGREVGSQEMLRMLYVLTAADLKGVGPETWTSWKGELLGELYEGAMSVFSNEQSWESNHRVAAVRELVKKMRRESSDPRMRRMSEEWVNRMLDSLPPNYLNRVPPTELLEHLVTMRRLEKEDVIVRGRHDRENDLTEYSVMTREEYGEGCFSKICGVLTAKRLEILSAQIITCEDGTVIDTFQVIDGDYTGTVPAIRMAEIGEAVREVLLGRQTVEKMLTSNRRYVSDTVPILLPEPPQIVTDNESSDTSTVIDVFAHDRRGLLFIISSILRELGLSVSLAKISTHLDQVVDVFYVTDGAGEKIRDENRLSLIRNLLTERIGRFQQGSEL